MKKKELIEILKKLLETDTDLDFLQDLTEEHLERLVACVRSRLDQKYGQH
ncbi:MAG: hypothetical protein R6V46_10180 [Desulfatiglandaceae bacterium]